MQTPETPLSPPPPPQAAASSNRNKVIACSLVALALLAVAIGVVFVGGAFFLGKVGLDMMAEQVRADIQDNPVIVEHLGEIREITTDFGASAEETAANVFVFDVVGSKGGGRLTANTVTVSADREEVTWGRLLLDSGEELDLFPAQGPKPTR
ncbi:MAG: hypothetical protein AAGA81_10605 [Acidobacteriota bacterium]